MQLHALEQLFFFVCKNFSSFRLKFPGKNCRQIYRKSNTSVCRKLSTVTAPKILCCSFSLQLISFFIRAVVCKLFFSYKHCNFSRGCLLVRMAFKTVTRSIKPRSLCNINIDWLLCQSCTSLRIEPSLILKDIFLPQFYFDLMPWFGEHKDFRLPCFGWNDRRD